MIALNVDKLIEWMSARSNSENVVVFAIYSGLIMRIKRGDFNEAE